MKTFYYLLIGFVLFACNESKVQQVAENDSQPVEKQEVKEEISTPTEPYLIVLGIAQDAGYPQANCKRDCCKAVWKDASKRKLVSCIALVEPDKGQAWIFDATPSFKFQLKILEDLGIHKIAGIFLTHAHIGHYTGLMHLGREVMGTKNLPVYAMPKMKAFLENNGPWSQLTKLDNIKIHELKKEVAVNIGNGLAVTPYQVPHRDEFSETVGFKIQGANKSAIFIPDIDKWQKWDKDVNEVIKANNIALLDGSFYQNGEIAGRDMSEIPHPFLVESMDIFKTLSAKDKAKVHFIHFNHTNPVLVPNSAAYQDVLNQGFFIAKEMQIFEM
jgi:pyrroloquinoline quinone biosynthesis protein B